MTNLPLFILFWTAVPLAIYRSQRRWRTFCIMLATWFGAAIGLAVVGAIVRPNTDPQQLGHIFGQVGQLLAVFAALWHSQRTRKATSAPAPPSVIV